MKRTRKLLVGLVILGVLAGAGGPAQAQTTSAGPYYATPSWDQKLQCDTLATCPRFIVLSNWDNGAPIPFRSSAAVLDRETGLVWEKAPDNTTTYRWDTGEAAFACANKSVGGRKGWRLPSINELASLLDPSVPFPGPTLPAGHPFTNVQSSYYWSATTVASGTSFAWVVNLSDGGVGTVAKTSAIYVWCVRGGGVMDNY